MTPEFGAASQLEKIDMLDFADVVAINKFERRGAEDALRDVGRQLVRNREAFGATWEDMPVFGTSAATFNDDGVTALYQHLRGLLLGDGLAVDEGGCRTPTRRTSAPHAAVIPPGRCATSPTSPRPSAATTTPPTTAVDGRAGPPAPAHGARAASATAGATRRSPTAEQGAARRRRRAARRLGRRPSRTTRATSSSCSVRDKELRTALTRETLSGSRIPRVALPRYTEDGELLRFLRGENLPGQFPFTAGVFPFKREGEDPARMFAGEGDAFRTNRRFNYLSADSDAKRLSTAFDSVTLYGRDPDTRPDVYGKVGTSGVSIATLDDMKVLYAGFDLCAPTTSVSMTINGPAPTILAFFLNTAIDQQIDAFRDEEGPRARRRRARGARRLRARQRARHGAGRHPQGGPGPEHLHLLHRVRAADDGRHPGVVHRRTRCATSTRCRSPATTSPRPARTRSASSPSRSPTASPIVEYYLARGMDIDDFAPNLSFFFSNGMDPEYTVIGRVARRIWARGHARALRRQRAQPEAQVPRADLRAGRCTRRRSTSTTSAPRCRRCARSTTTATRCTPTPTTRRSPRRPRSRCAARWPSS